MDIRPLHDRVVVKRIEEGESMQGGLYIPDSAKEKPQQGEVVAVGKGKRTEDGKQLPMDVAVGDRVLFGKYSGNDIPKSIGEEYLIMREDEIFAVLSNGSSNGKK
jgi:chaperonin GroES